MKPVSTSPYHSAATKSHTQRGWLQRIAQFFHFARSTPEQPVKAGAYQRPSPGAKKPFNGKTPQATTSTTVLPPEQASGNTDLYAHVTPRNERGRPQTQHQEPVQVQEQSAEITRPRPAPRQCNQHKLVKTPDDNASPGPNPESQANQVKTSDDNATLQQEQQPDPVCTLAQLLTSIGVEPTPTDNAEGMIRKFASHVQATLAPMKSPAEKKRYLVHTKLLLGNMSSRLGPVTNSRNEVLQAISTYTSSIDNDLEELEKVLNKQKNVRK